jgi:hypothetical protein
MPEQYPTISIRIINSGSIEGRPTALRDEALETWRAATAA